MARGWSTLATVLVRADLATAPAWPSPPLTLPHNDEWYCNSELVTETINIGQGSDSLGLAVEGDDVRWALDWREFSFDENLSFLHAAKGREDKMRFLSWYTHKQRRHEKIINFKLISCERWPWNPEPYIYTHRPMKNVSYIPLRLAAPKRPSLSRPPERPREDLFAWGLWYSGSEEGLTKMAWESSK